MSGLAPVAARWRPMRRWRLSSRMAALSLLLLLAVQALGLAALRSGVERNARATLADELAVAERVWRRLLEQRAARLTQGATVLAADYGFRAAVASGDRGTIESALDNHGARIGATQVAWLDNAFAVQVHAAPAREAADEPSADPVARPARASTAGPDAGRATAADPTPATPSVAASHASPVPRDTAAVAATLAALGPALARAGALVAVVDGRPSQFVMVPLRAPLQVGWVLMGFELEHAVVADLRALTDVDATLVLHAPGAASRPVLTSLRPAGGRDAAAAAAALATAAGDAGELSLLGTPHLRRALAVSADDGRSPRLTLSLTRSLADAVAPYRALQLTLAALTLLGLALFGAGSVWLARRVTQPLARLLLASQRLGRGDIDTPLAADDRDDEIGDLGRAFETMRRDIGRQQHEIRDLAYRDRLTALPNRAGFGTAVQAAIARGAPLAVVMLDLDRFKHVNDVLGYAFGDRLLQGVAERLRQAVRPGDLVARLGGDEFALLLPGVDATLAQQLVQRIAASFEAPLNLEDQRVDLSAGLGIACFPDHADAADALLNRAEVAMYAAKRHTAGAQLYDASLDAGSAQTLSLLSELRRAVDAGELRLFLQPKVALADGRLCGAEGLVRWQHPARGLVPPVQFIPFAEQTGFVRQLTLWVVEEAARQQAALRALGVERLSINLSTRDLMDTALPEKFDALLQRHGARVDGFCLEITESAIMDDPERAEATLNRLAERGYKLSIDDFGTGYSSLAYLKRLPVKELKIDRSFVVGMDAAARGSGGGARAGGAGTAGADGADGDAQIVRSTIDLAHNLGLRVVAEGVENAAVLQRLVDLGCDEAQGYHLGRPMPLAELQRWAAQRSLPGGAADAHRAGAPSSAASPPTTPRPLPAQRNAATPVH